MTYFRSIQTTCAALLLTGIGGIGLADPLPSWQGASKGKIITFVEAVSEVGGPEYVTPADRIAVFDNDGTLWAEQPVYFQLFFALDRVAKIGAEDPSKLTSDALKAAAAGDMDGVLAGGKEGLIEILALSHANQSLEAFSADVAAWVADAKHPTTGYGFDQMTYQPMVELLSYLRDEGFKTYIVSGGGIDFMRVFAEDAYGIPSEQTIGSSLTSTYEVIDGVPTIMKGETLFFNDDKGGKPVAINHHIGKRPIIAVGNSDGDFEMLEYTTAGDGPRLGVYIHHTDADREWAYDREGHIGVLNRGLDEAEIRGWVLVDMKDDWNRIFTGDSQQ
ncbi:HAD family hydrolase [Shimia sp. NS0008-38b]|uniref:HAD family hydrolase n=1 Tax=Shimia sp. NS0008-38b TaxID=3127653 RepID=UPI003101D2D8